MELKVCAVRDNVVEAFMQPIFVQTTAQAERMFRDQLQDDQSPMSRHPEDYTLMYLANYDDNAGMFTPLEPTRLLNGLEVRGASNGSNGT